jgi:hypothetical protein
MTFSLATNPVPMLSQPPPDWRHPLPRQPIKRRGYGGADCERPRASRAAALVGAGKPVPARREPRAQIGLASAVTIQPQTMGILDRHHLHRHAEVQTLRRAAPGVQPPRRRPGRCSPQTPIGFRPTPAAPPSIPRRQARPRSPSLAPGPVPGPAPRGSPRGSGRDPRRGQPGKYRGFPGAVVTAGPCCPRNRLLGGLLIAARIRRTLAGSHLSAHR